MRGAARLCLVILAFAAAACNAPALTQEQIVPAFIAATQDAARTMRMDWQGTMSIAQSDAPEVDQGMSSQSVDATFDFNGPDFAGTMRTGMTSSTTNVSYARISGVTFINYSDSGWQRADAFGGADVVPEMDPFHAMTAGDLAYEAPDTLDGRPVHRLRVLDPLAALNGALFGQVRGVEPTLSDNGVAEFLIYVDANAIPVGAHIALDLSMNWIAPDVDDGANIEYEIRFDYTFSLWGEPVTISPPQVTDGGGIDDFRGRTRLFTRPAARATGPR
jgi:hypothetical protein